MPATDRRGNEPELAPVAGAQRAPASGSSASNETTTVNLVSPVQRAPAGRKDDPGGREVDQAGRPQHSEEELEDLAHQLYGRIGRRLRRELLVDRERIGLALDLP
jgi:hypothetical protein